MRGFNEYLDFARDELGYTEYEAHQYAVARVTEDQNRNTINMQSGRVFRCNPEQDLWDDDAA